MAPRLTYEKLQEEVEAKECKLLTTEQEFKDVIGVPSKAFYTITASCGHTNRVKYDMFKAQNCGMVCKDCMLKRMEEQYVVMKNDISHHGQEIEYKGFVKLREILKEWFVVSKMVEGTLADFAIKPLNVEDDLWMPIQLKVTIGPNALHSNNYAFIIHKDYPDMTIVLFSTKDSKMWLLNGNDVLGEKRICIGSKKSKNAKYHVTNTQAQFQKAYDIMTLYGLDSLNDPISKNQKREQYYRRMREEKLPYLSFEYPERDGLPYDFTVNGVKVQEKVASLKRTGFDIAIKRKNTGHYHKGDADIYWINMPNSKWFFLIPEAAMINYKCVADGANTCIDRMTFYPENTSLMAKYQWTNKYKFSYDDVTEEEMSKIFLDKDVVPKHIKLQEYNQQKITTKVLGRRIQCMNDDVEMCFYSITDAATFMQTTRNMIKGALKRGNVVCGFFWDDV